MLATKSMPTGRHDKLNSNEKIATTSDHQRICESQAHQLTLHVVLLILRRTCVGVLPRGVTLLSITLNACTLHRLLLSPHSMSFHSSLTEFASSKTFIEDRPQ
ncbi:hypothetical protein T11_7867 [Trichinella zimbabwensis]|uniref:Uncharacterized protein n=1 Tax=Trichinella zimbabwensis TaxID=268475 RepID=A0A0V1HXK6_9BILA|nr:hypothetical protein T11_7867 [Trichinella zimbabwensis]